MVKDKTIAIIPARGGSKRIPRKNIIDFFGKPLIAYTIEAAINSKIFDKVIVSTDDEEIADISKKYGAEVPFLRDIHADDYSNVSDVIISTLTRLELEKNEKYQNVFMLMPNCPIRDEEDIQQHFEAFQTNNRNFQISGFEYGWMNPWWAHTMDDSAKATPFFKEALTKRSQDLDKLYCPTGAIWIASVSEIYKSKTFYGPDFHFSLLNWKSAVDIDDYDDLEMAKAIYLVKNNNT